MAFSSLIPRDAVWVAALFLASGHVEAMEPGRRDPHSLSNPDQVVVRRVRLDLTVDFERHVLTGAATLGIERLPGCPEGAPLILDTRGLAIEKVETIAEGDRPRLARFTLGPTDPILGAALIVELPRSVDQVVIGYSTTADSCALQWIDPPRTAGKKQPFLFTQSQAIHARSWIPLQDSPGVRVTYEATIVVPEGLTAIMGAEHGPVVGGTYHFRMERSIPPYLIALAVGELSFRPLGPRTGVYAERPIVDAAASEFFDTDAMIEKIERRYGRYRWGRYDFLMLPPSFPFGGMENPMLTFATPTILAGDRSLISLLAHELAHSWSGNLVSNATWSDFWLNEGFTTYLERRILEDVFGPERADMEAVLGYRELNDTLKKLPERDQVLHVALAGRDPEEAMNSIAYEKGALFLTALERAFGRERFDAFLRGYFDHFAFRSITTGDFQGYLEEHLLALDPEVAATVDVHAWLDSPGLPKGHPVPQSEKLASVEKAAQDWFGGRITTASLRAADWSTQEWIHFLQSLPDGLPGDRMGDLDRAYGLTERHNAEIAEQWLLMAIRNRYVPADARLETFLSTIGRRKFVVPLFAALAKTPQGKDRARAIYARVRSSYHPITVEALDRLLRDR